MSKQSLIKSMTGYKATDADMRCRGVQFKLGEWVECSGELELCKNGFHFCPHPSGPWAYYDAPGTRVFKVEAEDVLDTPTEPGADLKKVARRIRLVTEIAFDGYGNTGNWNTGNWNTGNWNTGDRNTGYRNTGDRNTGYGNTGDRNTGDRNTGYGNTGDRNTGDRNTGDRNTGDRNTGYGNAGYGNACDRSAGFFCSKEPRVVSFDKQTKYTHQQFTDKFPEYWDLCEALAKDSPIQLEPYKRIPGITKAKLAALHKKHIAGRKAKS